MTTCPVFRRHGDVLVLRTAVLPLRARPDDWPDVESPASCRAWLTRVWSDDAFVVPLRAASPRLVGFVERILNGDEVPQKRVRSATLSVAGYLLRASDRATPFGLFAGVTLAGVGPVSATFGTGHRAVARPDTLWVDHVRRTLQRRTDVLPHLTIQVSTLSFRRGDAVCAPRPGGRLASAPVTRPIAVLLRTALAPASGRHLLDALIEAGGTPEQAARLIGQALEDGYLTSDLTAPMTDEDPARHIVSTLRPHVDALEPDTVRIIDRLGETGRVLALHNRAEAEVAPALRAVAEKGMREIEPADCRSRISLDLRVHARVTVEHQVLDEVERAAHTLLRLTRAQGESPAWAAYQTQFWERYGAGVLVPVQDAADLAAGIGLPADYPLSVWSEAPPRVLPRDEQLVARAMQAAMTGDREIVLTEQDIDDLADTDAESLTAPHVEIGFRIRAVDRKAVRSGDFTLDVRPAWTAGVLSGRFASVLGHRLSGLYRTLPTMTRGALSAQLSFVPGFPHAQNVSRIPALLPHVIPVGETRAGADDLIGIDDLAVFSTGERLHLVSMDRRRIVEPHVLHPLALEKQAPPLVRFLAQLGRGFATAWTAFDWGPVASALPFLPRVRHRRTVLAPARWKLSAADLPTGPYGPTWHRALDDWAATWRCPARVQLLDDDRGMTVDRTEPLHARLIHQHLRRTRHAVLTEAVDDEELGWLGHAHEITVPLVTTRPQAPHPDLTRAPVVRNRDLARPGDPEQRWTQAKVFTHPTAMDQILTLWLPRLLDALGTFQAWFVRYRSLQETDHLRIRVPTGGPDGHEAALRLRALSDWTKRLTEDRLASQLVLDGYRPEIGRYGTGAAMDAAEDVFVADSLVARYALTDVPALEREAVCALNMVDMAEGFLGTDEGRAWTARTPSRTPARGAGRPDVTRQTVDQVTTHPLLNATPRLARAVAQRRAALGAYRSQTDASRLGQTLESLLHMHHNRLIGPDRDSEAASRHAARQACRSLVLRRTP